MRNCLAALFLAAVTPAYAGEGVFCHGTGDGIEFRMSSNLSDDYFRPLDGGGAEVSINLPSFPSQFRHVSFGIEDLQLLWLDEEVINLRFRAQSSEDPNAFLELLVTTKVTEDWYRGPFTVTLDEREQGGPGTSSTQAQGEAQCGADALP